MEPGDRSAHGTAVQRSAWFMRGYGRGVAAACDTGRVPAG
ncbi:MAG: neutral zinc metallopeptidase [Thermoleophilia bacterium]